MGRPSLLDQRREQILDAVVACVLRYGLDGATRSRIAEAAGVSPSAVHHFVGTRQTVIRTALARALDTVTVVAIDAFADLPAHRRLESQLDVLFAGPLAEPEVNQLVDELIAHSYRDDDARDGLRAAYGTFLTAVARSVDEAYPLAPAEDRAAVTHGLLALAHAHATFRWLDFDPDHYRHARRAAALLLETLV